MRLVAGAAPVIALAAAGCGGSSGSDESKTTTPSETTSKAATPRLTRAKAQLEACVKKTGAKLRPEPSTLKGRIAVGGAGNLPATYVGALVWPNGAYVDVWLADDAKNGAATADKLNKAQARALGVTEAEGAFNNGRAVGAPGNTKAFANLPLDALDKVDACLAATNG